MKVLLIALAFAAIAIVVILYCKKKSKEQKYSDDHNTYHGGYKETPDDKDEHESSLHE